MIAAGRMEYFITGLVHYLEPEKPGCAMHAKQEMNRGLIFLSANEMQKAPPAMASGALIT